MHADVMEILEGVMDAMLARGVDRDTAISTTEHLAGRLMPEDKPEVERRFVAAGLAQVAYAASPFRPEPPEES